MPYAQRVVCVMGAAALVPFPDRKASVELWRSWFPLLLQEHKGCWFHLVHLSVLFLTDKLLVIVDSKINASLTMNEYFIFFMRGGRQRDLVK